ncbi:MAG TPA: SDR family oxidoreductase, partial [Blastocatellia bacterium]|nr:SDR family oxidoreductase [Blastocatellia bacterium]
AEEAGPYNITVNTIAPGPVHGERMTEVIRRRAVEMGLPFEEVERQFVGPAALKRMVDEEDIAATALFLASDDAGNITGETLTVSAGYRL